MIGQRKLWMFSFFLSFPVIPLLIDLSKEMVDRKSHSTWILFVEIFIDHNCTTKMQVLDNTMYSFYGAIWITTKSLQFDIKFSS
jgi:hypothetical protein